MKPSDFNESSQIARYSYVPCPVNSRAFQILRMDDEQIGPKPVGDYTVLDREEDISLSEKKLINFISSLNGREDRVIDLSNIAEGTLLYNVLNERDENNMSVAMFYKQTGSGVSKENALIRVEYDESIWE